MDIAIRMGKLADSTMGVRRFETLQRYVVAAPSYLAEHGVPRTPAELSEHDCIAGPGSFGSEGWVFTKDATVTSINVQGRVQTRSGPGVISSATAGLGVAMSTNLAAAEALRSGALLRLLDDYEMPPVEVHAVFPQGPRPSPKVRSVVEFLAERIACLH